MVAECGQGHGGQSLYDTFAGGRDKNEIVKQFLDTPMEKTIPDQWEAQILCRILLKHKVIMVTGAPESMVRDMQMDYAESVEKAIPDGGCVPWQNGCGDHRDPGPGYP